MRQKIKVGIIDDHNLFRSGIAEIVEDSEKYTIDISVSDSCDLFKTLTTKKIEILLLDVRLKGEDGLDVLNRLKEEYPDIKVIMLTMHNEASYINTFIQAGAQGYLTKDTTPFDLLNTMDRVHEEGKYFDEKTTSILIDSIQSRAKLFKDGLRLSEVEMQILGHISEGKTAEEIAHLVFKSARTVEGIRQKLLAKTNTRNIAELVAWGFQNGVLG